METVTLGGGCFWCLEAAFQQINGIEKVVSGYAGGSTIDPSYEQVCSGSTGHAEVVQITFNPKIISFSDILDIFWAIHNPTTRNRQGNDIGTQYRSVIFYSNENQRVVSQKSKQTIAASWEDPVVTEILPLEIFYPAEEYHQNYFRNHPEAAYCQVVINPKLQKLRQKFASKLKLDEPT